MSFLTGGSKQSSSSKNQAYGEINNAFSPQFSYASNAGNSIQNLLGIGGQPAQMDAFNNFKNSAGYQATMNAGTDAIDSSQGAKGLFRSGATGKALEQFGQGIGQTYMNQYLQSLSGLANQGLQAGQLVAGAGQTTKSSGSSKNGIGKLAGSIAGGIAASDPRLKEHIEKVGEFSDGLGLYKYKYLNGDTPYVGVMADEVAELRPWALGPEIDGYMTVNYSKLHGGANVV